MKLVIKQAAGTTVTIEVRRPVYVFGTHQHTMLSVLRMDGADMAALRVCMLAV